LAMAAITENYIIAGAAPAVFPEIRTQGYYF
jgi:hypothetical protein